MAFPANLDTIVVRHKITDAAGRPLKGNTVTAEPAERVWATDGSIVQYRATTQIDANGQWELELPYVDQEGIRNKGVPWRVTEHVPGQPKSYFVAPVLAHGAGPIDAAECLVSAPTSRETVIQAGPVTDEAAASLLAQDGEFKAALMDTIGTEADRIVPGKVAEAIAEDDTIRQAAVNAVTTELVEGEAGRHYGARPTANAPSVLAPRHRPTWITTFQDGHGWTNPLPYGDITADTSDYVMGTQSVQLANGALQRTGLGVDLTKNMLCLWVKAVDLPPDGIIYVYAGDASLSNSRSWTVRRGTDAAPWFHEGEWAFVTLPVESSSVTGTPDDANISNVRVRGFAQSVIKVNGVGTIPLSTSPFPGGVVSITFDDGYTSVYQAARRSMTPRGLSGTAYVIPHLIGDSTGNFMTEDELADLHAIHGWNIEAHALDSVRDRTTESLREEFASIKRWIAERGLGRGDHFAYPGGQHDPHAVKVAREFFTTARTIASYPLPETLPPAMPHLTRALSGIGHTTSVATVQQGIDRAMSGGYWLNLVFHRIVDGPTQTGNDCTWEDFNTILDYLVASGVEVRTVDEVMRRAT